MIAYKYDHSLNYMGTVNIEPTIVDVFFEEEVVTYEYRDEPFKYTTIEYDEKGNPVTVEKEDIRKVPIPVVEKRKVKIGVDNSYELLPNTTWEEPPEEIYKPRFNLSKGTWYKTLLEEEVEEIRARQQYQDELASEQSKKEIYISLINDPLFIEMLKGALK